MTHDELKEKITIDFINGMLRPSTLMAVVELHKPDREGLCRMSCADKDDDGYSWTHVIWPCPTIQAIEKELR